MVALLRGDAQPWELYARGGRGSKLAGFIHSLAHTHPRTASRLRSPAQEGPGRRLITQSRTASCLCLLLRPGRERT